jgi:hypothetical protein
MRENDIYNLFYSTFSSLILLIQYNINQLIYVDMKREGLKIGSHLGKSLLNRFRYVALAGILLFAVSCEDDDDDDNGNGNPDDYTAQFLATLNGSSEVPPNASTATGNASLTYNQDTKVFTIVVTYSGVTATGAHIHLGSPTESGGVVFGFTSLESPINYTSPPLTEDQEDDLFANLYYVNIHSRARNQTGFRIAQGISAREEQVCRRAG